MASGDIDQMCQVSENSLSNCLSPPSLCTAVEIVAESSPTRAARMQQGDD